MHGGDVYSNDINLDFSVNLNPLGMPENVRKAIADAAGDLEHYPDPEYRTLRRLIGIRYGIAPKRIVCGNGASELIMAVCRAFLSGAEQSKALILAPGFTGYRYALRAVHGDVITVELHEEDNWVPDDTFEDAIAEEEPNLVVLANPSNPTGVLIPRERLIGIANICEDVGAILCVDECFMELTDDYMNSSMSICCSGPVSSCPNLIVLNAITKTFAVPGIRLGYAFCASEHLAGVLGQQVPEWNVSTLAEAAASAAFHTDPAYLNDARSLIRRERTFLDQELSDCGFQVYLSEANYILFHSDTNLYEPLLKQKILIRDCSDYEGLGEGWYRIAVRNHEENGKLMEGIRDIFQKASEESFWQPE